MAYVGSPDLEAARRGPAAAPAPEPAPAGADPEKRQRILEAAVRVFGRRGYHDAKIAEIASQGRVAEGTVYLYFRNKEHLFGTVFDEKMDELLAKGREIVAAPASASERLTGLVDLHLTFFAADRDLASLFQIELRRSARMLQRVIRSKLIDYFRLLGSVLKDGIATGEFRPQLSPRLAVRVLFGAADEIVSEWLFSGGDPDLLADAKNVVGMLLEGIAQRQHGQGEPGGRVPPGQRGPAPVVPSAPERKSDPQRRARGRRGRKRS